MVHSPRWDYDAWLADSTRPDPTRWMTEMYGDYRRLDAYPWIADRDTRDDGLPVDLAQESRDTLDGARGRVTRHWRVSGDSDMGLPRKADQKLHLEILMRTIAADGENGEIEYDYHDLASSVGLNPGSQSYERIDRAIDRLASVKIIFNGRPTVTEQDGRGVESHFGLVGGCSITIKGNARKGSLYWSRPVVASLRSVVGVHQANYSKGQDDTEEAQAALKRLLIKMMTYTAAKTPASG